MGKFEALKRTSIFEYFLTYLSNKKKPDGKGVLRTERKVCIKNNAENKMQTNKKTIKDGLVRV